MRNELIRSYIYLIKLQEVVRCDSVISQSFTEKSITYERFRFSGITNYDIKGLFQI